MLANNQSLHNTTAKTATTLPHLLFQGTTWHNRLLPNKHKFAYPYRYWGINISALAAGQALPEVTASVSSSKVLKRLPFTKRIATALPLFSAKHKALQQFCPEDYLQTPESTRDDSTKNMAHKSNNDADSLQALKQRLTARFMEQTGSAPTGAMMGMVVCRNAGLYFSPVNFYLGFDEQQTPTHLLAEVSNTPWNKRHYYGFLLEGAETEFCHDKDFHVSPFNPIDQLYRWQVSIIPPDKKQVDKDLQVRIAIDISDARGEVLKTGIKMTGVILNAESVQQSLRRNPLMNISSLSRIYGHAFKLYAIKKIPYINYDETLADSQQHQKNS